MYNIAYGQDLKRDSIQIILEEAYQRDQAPRKIIDSLMRSGILDGNKYLPAIEQQQRDDSMNLVLVPPLIDKICESQMYDLDSMAYEACWLVIQHAPDSIMHKYEDFIKLLVVKKLISVDSYMAYIDRCKVRQSKAQIYGWQFKRFSNGLIIQFPILMGFETKWNELGLEYKESCLISDEYKVRYDYNTCIDDTQFAILGVVSHNRPNQNPDEVSISINNIEIAKRDSLGFFKAVFNKQDLPVTVKVATKNVSKEYMVKQNNEIDYIFLNCLVDENTIDITNE
ncbi:hypothetical protein [Bacteroides sp.]